MPPIPMIKMINKSTPFSSSVIILSIVICQQKISSQLGPQKLRKFLEFYPEFYPKAKTNKKLYSSIMRAEQKLKHNGVNTDYYVNFRQSLKKGKKGKSGNHTQSRISSQDHGQQLMSELPQLNKNKTFERRNRSQSQQSISHVQKHQSAPQKTRGRPSTKKKQQKIVKMKSQSSEEQEEEEEIIKKSQQKQIFQEEEEQPVKLANRTRSRQNARFTQNKIQKEKSESQSSQQSELQNFNDKKSNQLKVNKVKPIVKTQARKRGRPKKIRPEEEQQAISIQKVQQNIPVKIVPKQKPKERSIFTQEKVQRIPPKRRALERRNMNEEQQNQSQNESMSQEKQENPIQSKQLNTLIIQRIKFCLNKRDELIEYLDQLPVGPQNVQQILELNVTSILLQGPPSIQVIRIMQKLKANLLYKFFPNDLKFKKKMQKINKKISNRNNTEVEQESLQDLELRKKTIIKLQKILRQSSPQEGEENNQKIQAIEIQSNFRKYDQTIGQAYKLLAYRILRSLKVDLYQKLGQEINCERCDSKALKQRIRQHLKCLSKLIQ